MMDARSVEPPTLHEVIKRYYQMMNSDHTLAVLWEAQPPTLVMTCSKQCATSRASLKEKLLITAKT